MLLEGDKLIHCLHAGVRCQAACCPLCICSPEGARRWEMAWDEKLPVLA